MADDCRPLSRRLDELFETVEPHGSTPFIERYRQAVGRDDNLEQVMKELLNRVGDVAKVPLVNEHELGRLNAALQEVKHVDPSLKNERAAHSFNNYSSGIQPVHLGKGHVNISSGNGAQINGNPSGGNFYFAPRD